MQLDLLFRDQLYSLGAAVPDELDNMAVRVRSSWLVEHTEDDGHGDITALSITLGDIYMDDTGIEFPLGNDNEFASPMPDVLPIRWHVGEGDDSLVGLYAYQVAINSGPGLFWRELAMENHNRSEDERAAWTVLRSRYGTGGLPDQESALQLIADPSGTYGCYASLITQAGDGVSKGEIDIEARGRQSIINLHAWGGAGGGLLEIRSTGQGAADGTIAMVVVGGGSTSAITLDIDGTTGGAFNTTEFFWSGHIRMTVNNKFLKGRTTGAADRHLIGINSSNLVSIDADGLGSVFAGYVQSTATSVINSFGGTAAGTGTTLKCGYATMGQTTGQYAWMGSNYTALGANWTYTNTDFASAINFNAGGFVFYTAPSGTAGNAITWTQRASLSVGGGLTLNSSTERLVFESGAAVASAIQFKVSSSALGYVGASGSFLGSSATNMMIAAESGKTVQIFADGSSAKYAELNTNAQWFLYNASGRMYLSPSGGDSGGAYLGAVGAGTGNFDEQMDYYAADHNFRIGNTLVQMIDGNGDWRPDADNSRRVGLPTHRYTLIRGVTITSGDLSFENGWTITEAEKVGIDEPGLAILDENNELVAFIGKGNLKRRGATGPEDVDTVPYTRNTNAERSLMDMNPTKRVKGYDEQGTPIFRDAAEKPFPDPSTRLTNRQRRS